MNNPFRPYWGILIGLWLTIFSAQAQVIHLSVSGATLCPGDSAILSVNATNFNNVASLSLSLLYNPASATYLGYQDQNPAFSSGFFIVNPIGNAVKIAWFSINPLTLENALLFKVRFRYDGDYGELRWDTNTLGACQIGNANGIVIPTIFTGSVLAANATFIHQAKDTSIILGDTASFLVQAYGSTLSYKWQENTGSAWYDVFNGTFYSGANSPLLSINGPPLAFSGNQYRCRTTGNCPLPYNYFYSDPASLTVSLPCTSAVSNAGPDTSIFAGQNFQCNASAQHYQSLAWSGGDGIFSNPTTLNPIYAPGPGDIANGSVALQLIAFASSPCENDTDQMLLAIQPLPVNHPPQFYWNGSPTDSFHFVTNFGQPITACTPLIDPDGDPVSLSAVIIYPVHGQLLMPYLDDSCFRYSPAPLFLGTDSLIIVACDNLGACDTASITITTTLPPYNLPPLMIHNAQPVSLMNINVQMNLGGEICVELFDPEGSACDVTALVSGALNGTVLGLNDGDSCLIYVPDTSFQGYDSLFLKICDTQGSCDTILLVLHILDLNVPYPPDALNDHLKGAEDQVLVCSVLQNDFDINMNIDTTELLVLVLPMHATLFTDTSAGIVAYYPQPDFWGEDSFSYRICDKSGLCDTAWVYIEIESVFDFPRNDTLVIDEDSFAIIEVLSNDQYAYQMLDSSTLSISVQPNNGNVYAAPGQAYLYIPTANFYGEDSLKYSICDTSGDCGTAWVKIQILPVNDAPELLKVNGVLFHLPWPQNAQQTCMGNGLDLTLSLKDPEGDTAYLCLANTQQSGSSVSIVNDSLLYYTPPIAFYGTDWISLYLSDGEDTNVRTVGVIINAPPFINAGLNASVCAGASFVAAGAQAYFSTRFKWKSYGSGFFLDDNLYHPTYIPSNKDIQEGSVKLEVTAFGYDSCGSHTDHLILSFLDLPQIELGGDTVLCENYSIYLDAGENFTSYLWSTGSTSRYETVDTSKISPPGGIVGVSVTDAGGCSNDDQIVLSFVACPGFKELQINPGLRLYPNPSDGYVFVESDSPLPDNSVIIIADMTGRIIYSRQLDGAFNNTSIIVDTSEFPSGVYLVSIQNSRFRLGRSLLVWHSF